MKHIDQKKSQIESQQRSESMKHNKIQENNANLQKSKSDSWKKRMHQLGRDLSLLSGRRH